MSGFPDDKARSGEAEGLTGFSVSIPRQLDPITAVEARWTPPATAERSNRAQQIGAGPGAQSCSHRG